MLSISDAKSAGGAVSYFSDHLVMEGAINPTEDYYANHGEAGQWFGKGAAELGLTGDVTAEDFGRMLLAIDQNGEKMVVNGGDENRRAGWDLTFSADKSVSSLWASSSPALAAQIKLAHDNAVAKAMSFIQDDGGIAARRGKGGIELENAKMIAAQFSHGTSRSQDPQLHTHNFLMNLAQRQDGSWGAVQSKEFFVRKMAAGALYRVELANQMQQLGFDIERDKRTFQVKGVSEDLQKHWSKRRQQVVAEMNKHGGKSAKSAEAAALSSRSKKEEVDQELLINRWHEEAAYFGLNQEKIAELQAQEKEQKQMPTADQIWSELTQHASTISDHQLKAAIFEQSQGILSADQAQDYLNEFIQDNETVILRDHRGNKRYTSIEMIELERSIIDGAKSRLNESHALPKTSVNIALANVPTISDEQRNMVNHITSNGGLAIVEGMAGTGKSFALGVANEAWKNEGFNIIGTALSGKAAEGLEAGSSIKSQTLHSLLIQLSEDELTKKPAARKLTPKDVIVLDEAGMVGSRQMSLLLAKAEEAGAKVVLVGDSKQLQPIDAGGSFRGLSKALGAASLTDIRRQRQGWHKDAITAFAEGDAGKALTAFKSRNLLQTGKTHDQTISKMVTQWKSDRDQNPNSDSLMLAATRFDVAMINQATRELIKDELTGNKITINNSEFQKNDRVLFTRNSKALNVKNGTLGIVLTTNDNTMAVMIDGDIKRTVVVQLDQYEHVQHGYAVTVHKSQGATVDRAYVLADERMSGQEWSYVAMSRSRDDTHIFCDENLITELEQTMSSSHLKDLSTDYQIEDSDSQTPDMALDAIPEFEVDKPQEQSQSQMEL
ncbi:MAG: relaxase domain-containing protein [Methylomarinum sp.]|nr:relaxase domain-containing protein [Methylomarinum sp.]